MKPLNRPININAMTRKLNVDNRISLRNYYRIADNLLKQASIYREERNLVDLYIILVRFSSLVSETIPCHRDYQVGFTKERSNYRKKLLNVMDEVESLKPRVQRQIDEVNRVYLQTRRNSPERTVRDRTVYSLESPFSKQNFSTEDIKQMNAVGRTTLQTSWSSNNENNQRFSSNSTPVEKLFDKLSVGLPLPKEETLSRHSILGQNGLRGQWLGPTTGMKVYYPSNADLLPENSGLTDCQSGGSNLIMDSVLSLDDGRWQNSADLSSTDNLREDLQINIIRQPSPPPVLAPVQRASRPISPSRVADPRPGPAHSQNGASDANSYQELHIFRDTHSTYLKILYSSQCMLESEISKPVKMMDDFLRLAQKNTAKNLETCGVLAGSLKNRVFCITTLIIPKQESTSDTCQTMNEEEIFEYQDRLSLFPLGWIHTHPSQTCFMSSVDLHTHYSYQIMLPEAIAIVMAPTDKSSPFGIFHLGDPGGVSVIRNCQERGFHPHEEPDDGSPIYEHCSHVYMNPDARFEVADLR